MIYRLVAGGRSDCQIRDGIHNFWDRCYHLYSSCGSVIQWYMIVLEYLRGQCTKFHTTGWISLFLASIYLELCIWLDVILQWRVCICMTMQPSYPGLSNLLFDQMAAPVPDIMDTSGTSVTVNILTKQS
jgi:hypothetical protein